MKFRKKRYKSFCEERGHHMYYLLTSKNTIIDEMLHLYSKCIWCQCLIEHIRIYSSDMKVIWSVEYEV